MKQRYWIITLFALMSATIASAQSKVQDKTPSSSFLKKVEKQKAKASKESARIQKIKIKEKESVELKKEKGTVYIFGVSTDLKSKDVYITEISTVDSMALQKKTNFLPFRSSFSIQFQQYTEGTLGKMNQTVSVFYDTDMKKLKKRLDKAQKFYMGKSVNTLNIVSLNDFQFVHPVDLLITSDE